MKIVMFAINPLYPDHEIGGAPKHLRNIAIHLGERGHTVRILCTQSYDSAAPFQWHPNVQVLPSLQFSLPFPMPYDIPAYDFANNIEQVAAELQTADRFYMHDGEFLFPHVGRDIPTVVSLRDNVYPETMIGAFNFQGDALICISDYSRQYYATTVGRFYPGLAERLHVVNNGIDFERFTHTPPSAALLDAIGFDPGQHAVLLHPHRPEPSKGLARTVAVADLLVKEHGIDTLRVLIPEWSGASASAEVKRYYEAMRREIEERGLAPHFVFHPWLSMQQMPEYYSLGDVMLSLGYFQEAFGNTPYEALACGTPAIVSMTATHRSLLPDHLIDKVPYADDARAAEAAARIIRGGERTSEGTLAYLRAYFAVDDQLAAVEAIITNAEKRPPLRYVYTPRDSSTRYALAPWCAVVEGRIFHDYLADYIDDPALVALLQSGDPLTAAALGDRLEGYIQRGVLVQSTRR